MSIPQIILPKGTNILPTELFVEVMITDFTNFYELKTRFYANGSRQLEREMNFEVTFSLVVGMASLRFTITISTVEGMILLHTCITCTANKSNFRPKQKILHQLSNDIYGVDKIQMAQSSHPHIYQERIFILIIEKCLRGKRCRV